MFGSSPSADFRAGEIKRPAQEIGREGAAGQFVPPAILPYVRILDVARIIHRMRFLC